MPKVRLVELYAHALGVIDDARLEFGPGFNVLTGETGAGKTLLLDALGLSLGGEAGEARYALSNETQAVSLFVRDRAELVFSRKSTPSGRLRSAVNDVVTSAESLRSLARELVVIHGQHESLALQSKSEILRLIDEFGSVSSVELDRVRRLLHDAHQLRDDSGGDNSAREREREFIRFQLDELERAKLTSPDELNDVVDELTRVSELRDGQLALFRVLELLDGERDDALLSQFARIVAQIPKASVYDDPRRALEQSLTQAREALRDLASLNEAENFDPVRLEKLEERVGELRTLARKYGGSLAAAISLREQLREQLARAHDDVERLRGLDDEIRSLERDVSEIARRVRIEREFGATRLSNAVRAQLGRVALANASLRFVVDGDDGSDADILFTPNPGGAEGPLGSMASGGELSRVLLAIALETANEDLVAVFDEIDAGLGGQVAQQIGECLREVGRRQQVLAVTHLASVAAKADHHFTIEKRVEGGRTTTRVREVVGDDRINEIARMLVGDVATGTSRQLAAQMLQNPSQDHLPSELIR